MPHDSHFRPYKPPQMAYDRPQQAYSLMPNYSPPVAYHRVIQNASPPLEDAVVRPLALRRHTSPPQQYATHLMVPPQHQQPMYHPHPHHTQYHRQVYLPHSPTPVSPAPSSPTLSIVPQFASDDDETGSGSGSGSAPSNNGAYIAMGQPPHPHPHYGHPPHMQMMQPITHYAMPVTQMRQITHVAVPTMQAQPTPASHAIIQHAHHPRMQQHHPHMMHHPYAPPHPGGFVMIAAPPHAQHHPQHHPQMQRMPMAPAVPVQNAEDVKPKGSKRTATQMREFVRSYFANHSSSLVNKDLSTISQELQVAYEREFPSHCLSMDKSDRKPVFCRTFIQKVARQMGFLLTLNYGLVDKRMKHLMKIRKRGKKAKKSENTENDLDESSPVGDSQTQTGNEPDYTNEQHQQQQQQQYQHQQSNSSSPQLQQSQQQRQHHNDIAVKNESGQS